MMLFHPSAHATDYALQFNGFTRARIPNDPSLEFSNPPVGTIEMWMRNDCCVDCHLLGKRAGCGSTFDFYQFVVLSKNPDWVYGGWGLGCSDGSRPLPPGWVHVAIACDGDSTRFYVNGELTSAADCQGHLQSASDLRIGISGDCAGFVGQIDDVRIWQVARTRDQIASWYRCRLDADSPGLVGYWTFDEVQNDQHVLDLSPSGNDGTLGETDNVESSDAVRVLATHPIEEPCTAGIPGESTPPSVTGSLHFVSIQPNPFWTSVKIAYEMPTAGAMNLRIYDATGHLARTLVHETETKGLHYAVWDGKNDAGHAVASGLYFGRIDVAGWHAATEILRLQ
jgi:hypothetical protein